MRIFKKIFSAFLISFSFIFFCFEASGEVQAVSSPDGNIEVKIQVKERIEYLVFFQSQEILSPSSISMTLSNGYVLGRNPKMIKVERKTINEKILPVVKEKRAVIIDNYNEIKLVFSGNYGLLFRVYNDGLAYRFFTEFKEKIKIISEEASFKFPQEYPVYFPFTKDFHTNFESNYTYLPISKVTQERMGFTPVLIDINQGPKIAITEADLDDYPGMFLTGSSDESPSLFGKFASFPLKEELERDRDLIVKKGADYIAQTEGVRSFPWRVLVIAENDGDLIESDMIFRLGKPLQLKDTSWIRPGKVAWDWWNANNVFGVNFKAGINTETYMYYIDFASEYGIEYIVLDEGWSDTTDLSKINPNIDMEKLLEYAKKKNVGIILWCIWITLDRQLHQALDLFEKWGVKGIKVDFMNRDDQKVVNFYRKIAREAAIRHLIVNLHGAFKPTGLRRSYPNVLIREGVLGLEFNKWSEKVTPEHDLLIPFIRMLAGPMDYTPGAMNNAQKKNFRALFTRPMSQGTRAHQLAMYVVYESPLQMLADSPSHYLREPEMMDFLSKVPTVWDETKVLEARVSDYVVIARKKGKEWYLGAMTDWTPRKLTVKCDFLNKKCNYTAEIYSDGPNASRYASDFKKVVKRISKNDTLEIELAPGGGWVARIYPQEN